MPQLRPLLWTCVYIQCLWYTFYEGRIELKTRNSCHYLLVNPVLEISIQKNNQYHVDKQIVFASANF